MLGYLPVIALQSMGVIIPLIGIIVLLKKGQGRTTPFLIMANFGALIMNVGYLSLLTSTNYQEVLSVYKFEYIGNAFFYSGFILYLKYFFLKNKKSKIFTVLFVLFLGIEIGTLGTIVTDSSYGLEDFNVQYREDDGSFYSKRPDSIEELNTETLDSSLAIDQEDGGQELPMILEAADSSDTETASETERNSDSYLIEMDKDGNLDSTGGKGYVLVEVVHGTALKIRYAYLAFLLLLCLLASCWMTFCKKDRLEQRKMIYLSTAEIVVFASLLISLLCDLSYDVVPIMASISILSIICGTANGDLFTVTDLGRGWVLDHSDSIFIIVDEKYRFLDANSYAQEVFPALAELPVHTMVPEELKNKLVCDTCDIDLSGKKYAKKVAPIIVKNKTVGYSIMLMDMTAHYELLAQVEEERQKAIDANEAKSNFMSNMSHEIRTPMNAIVGMTELMLRRDQDAINLEYLNNIKNSGNALLTVINDILDFSKIESGKLELIPDEYEIMSVLNDLSLIFLNRIGEKPIELIYDIDPKMPHKLVGDPGRIRQVLTNIVNNGIKYTDEGYVKLTMTYQPMEDNKARISCSVEDSGIGIKEEDLPKIFSNFSQVDTKKNRGKEGTGLGLSIAKQLVEAMGGQITVDSLYGKGTTFSFSMVQDIVDEKPAASVKSDKKLFVSGKLSYSLSQEILKKLCSYYSQVEYLDLEEAIREDKQLDFIFLESNYLQSQTCPDQFKPYLEKYKPELLVVHNPMLEGAELEGVTVINKPLYTLNFCLAINHEVLSFQERQEQLMSFVAPDASILLVDDNEMNRKVALGLMEPLGMHMDAAADGKKAVELIKEGHYDIVFMDHMMPIMDGIEATKLVRSLEGAYYQNLPIIALSANALSEAREQFKAAGMNDFLAKPIKTKELFKTILKYLPEEKIQKGQEREEEVEIKEEELPVIEGLDVRAGLENSGGAKLFYSLLGDFYKLIDRKSIKIEKCLADDMIRDFTIEVHALKNTARMIGALELSDQFYQLEQAGNAEDMETIKTQTPVTLELYRSYKPILAPYAASDNQNKPVMDKLQIIEAVEYLKASMDSFDLDGVDTAMKELESSGMPEEIRPMIEDLGALVADVAMEEVMDLCDQILTKLGE